MRVLTKALIGLVIMFAGLFASRLQERGPIAAPSAPFDSLNVRLIGYYDTPDRALGVYVVDSFAYVADHTGLCIINVSNPSSPYEAGYYDTPGDARGVYASVSYIYVGDGHAGLEIYQYYGQGISEDAPERLSQVRLLSNPVQKHIELSFSPPLEKGMDLNLYNAIGQRIKTYHIKKGFSGRVKLSVNGLSSGIYFLRSEDMETSVIKVVVVEK